MTIAYKAIYFSSIDILFCYTPLLLWMSKNKVSTYIFLQVSPTDWRLEILNLYARHV